MKKSELRQMIREELMKVKTINKKLINESKDELYINRESKKLTSSEITFRKKIISEIIKLSKDYGYDPNIKLTNYGFTYTDSGGELYLIFINDIRITPLTSTGKAFNKNYYNIGFTTFLNFFVDTEPESKKAMESKDLPKKKQLNENTKNPELLKHIIKVIKKYYYDTMMDRKIIKTSFGIKFENACDSMIHIHINDDNTFSILDSNNKMIDKDYINLSYHDFLGNDDIDDIMRIVNDYED